MEVKILEQNVIISAYSTKGGINELFERVAQEVRKEVPDVTTDKGRKAIGSLAAKVSKSKKIIEEAGKALVAEQKAQIKLIDDDRIAVVKMFDSLRDEVLAPRDAWEQAEEDRIELIENKLNSLKQEFGSGLSADIKRDIERIKSIEIDDSFMEFQDKAKLQKYETLELLESILIESLQREEHEAEQERLRIAEQARLQREHEERIAREAAEKATREAEEKARFEAERVEREKRESEQREARLKAEKEAALLREAELRRQAEAQAKQAEIDRKKAIQAERLRIEQEAKAKHDSEIEEAKKREADQAHKKQVCDSIIIELGKLGISEEIGKELIKAIHAKKIPNVTLAF